MSSKDRHSHARLHVHWQKGKMCLSVQTLFHGGWSHTCRQLADSTPNLRFFRPLKRRGVKSYTKGAMASAFLAQRGVQ